MLDSGNSVRKKTRLPQTSEGFWNSEEMGSNQIITKSCKLASVVSIDPAERGYKRRICLNEREKEELELKYKKL